MNKKFNKNQNGFSLVELSIVLVVIGLMLGGIIGSTSALIQTAQSHEADKELELIRESLIGFLLANGRLPCADSDGDGMEDTCADDGNLPFAQLGVSRRDPWGGDYLYHVDTDFADEPFPATTPSSSFTLTEPDPARINVRDGIGAGTNTVATGMAVIVVSSGLNGSDGSDDEDENTDGDHTFVQKIYSTKTGEEFDDRLMWISPMILRAKMLEAGRLP